MICAPKSLPVFLSLKILTRPSVWVIALALEFAKNGKLPFEYYTPWALSSSSVNPTAATSG